MKYSIEPETITPAVFPRSTERACRIGIIILNQNGSKWLPQIYNSIRAQQPTDARIYLADNASNDDSIELTLQNYPEVTVIRFPQNLGYSMAYNLAMPYVFSEGCDYVIWANNDVKLEPGCLAGMVRAAQSNPIIGILGPGFWEWEKDQPNTYILGNHPRVIRSIEKRSCDPLDVEWVEGSFLMVSRRCYEGVGPLDPCLFFYWEDADFCRRARFQGWRVVLVPAALARHYAGGWAEAKLENQKNATNLQTRNFYIYKLANPFQGFLRNCADAMHLFLLNIKEAFLADPRRVLFHLRVFGGLLRHFRPVYAKWNRDRAGKHPNPLLEDLATQILDILPGRIQV
jgi:GT2 family glycosyltransferase